MTIFRHLATLTRHGLFATVAMAAAIGAPTAAAAPSLPMGARDQAPQRWTGASAAELVAAVEAAGAEGLDPADYGLARLQHSLEGGQGMALDAAADASALALAHDYAFGRVADREAMDWHIANGEDMNSLVTGLRTAVAAGEPRRYIESLLPSDRRYLALRDALATAADGTTRDRLRVNMERWRWMPRAMDSNYLYVNVPSYRLQVIDDGAAVSSYTVVVGAPDTPTPQLIAPASSLVVNPWWNVPVSIVRKSNMRPGRAGFLFKANADGSMAVRQPPGPRNALGRIKINLIDDQAIYLHDTPAKSGFARDERALSHGCVRVKDIDRLAGELVGDGGKLDAALADDRTQTLRLDKTWKVYLVYFTADVGEDGQVVSYGDPYRRDAEVKARLDGRAMQIASR